MARKDLLSSSIAKKFAIALLAFFQEVLDEMKVEEFEENLISE